MTFRLFARHLINNAKMNVLVFDTRTLYLCGQPLKSIIAEMIGNGNKVAFMYNPIGRDTPEDQLHDLVRYLPKINRNILKNELYSYNCLQTDDRNYTFSFDDLRKKLNENATIAHVYNPETTWQSIQVTFQEARKYELILPEELMNSKKSSALVA